MAKEPLALYLVLAPEFGGTRFGPFEGLEVRIGSDPGKNDITVPETLGARPSHAKLILRGREGYLLTPAERSAGVWLWQGASRRPVAVTSPTAVQNGDSFSLVTPEGPRFRLELGALPPEIAAKRKKSAYTRRRFSPSVWFAEIRRFSIASIYTFSPVALAMRAWYAITSGAIFHPRILLPMLAIMGGYGACTASSCSALRYRSMASKATTRTVKCEEKLGYAENLGKKVEDWTFDQLAAVILESVDMGPALQGDPALLEAVRKEAAAIAADPRAYEWIRGGDQRQDVFARWRERMDANDDLDPTTRRLAAYLAAPPDRLPGDWDKLLDTREELVCGRGPLRLTYRQARNLGLMAVQLDAYAPGDASTIDPGARGALLARTAETAGQPITEVPPSEAQVLLQGAATCVYATGTDDREDAAKLSRMIGEVAGKRAKYVPDSEDAMGPVARIAKLYAADIPEVNWRAERPPLELKRGVANSLKGAPGGDRVLSRTAEVVARALVLPCDGVLNGDAAKMQAVFGDLPDPVPCLVLNYRLTHQ